MNKHLQWVARGVFHTTEGAVTNGGGLDQHLTAVYGQGQDLPEFLPADPTQEQTGDDDVQTSVEGSVDTEDSTAQPEETPEVQEHVPELSTPPLVEEVFGALIIPEEETKPVPVEVLPRLPATRKTSTAKKPAKKKPSSK